jgi:hypothetical protein
VKQNVALEDKKEEKTWNTNKWKFFNDVSNADKNK